MTSVTTLSKCWLRTWGRLRSLKKSIARCSCTDVPLRNLLVFRRGRGFRVKASLTLSHAPWPPHTGETAAHRALAVRLRPTGRAHMRPPTVSHCRSFPSCQTACPHFYNERSLERKMYYPILSPLQPRVHAGSREEASHT